MYTPNVQCMTKADIKTFSEKIDKGCSRRATCTSSTVPNPFSYIQFNLYQQVMELVRLGGTCGRIRPAKCIVHGQSSGDANLR